MPKDGSLSIGEDVLCRAIAERNQSKSTVAMAVKTEVPRFCRLSSHIRRELDLRLQFGSFEPTLSHNRAVGGAQKIEDGTAVGKLFAIGRGISDKQFSLPGFRLKWPRSN